MTNASEIYAAMVRATDGARQRTPAGGPALNERWSPGASRFREDPFRENETLAALLAYIEPDDVVLDVGGGAGRYLPIAGRCKELVNVEPSSGMGAQFEEAVREAGVTNAPWLQSDWFDADIEGDVTFCANVIYYIEDVARFVAKLDAASRRRVMIVMHSVPPTNVGANLYELIRGRNQATAPSHRELLPVLWDMGLLPDVHVMGPSDFIVERPRYASREAAIEAAVPASLDGAAGEQARSALDQHFDELFESYPAGYGRRQVTSRVLLITWETRH